MVYLFFAKKSLSLSLCNLKLKIIKFLYFLLYSILVSVIYSEFSTKERGSIKAVSRKSDYKSIQVRVFLYLLGQR